MYAWCVVAWLSSAAVLTALVVTGAPGWAVVIGGASWASSNMVAAVVWNVARERDRNNAVPRARVASNGRKPS